MNEKKVKALRKKIKPLQVEWLKTLLNDEEASQVSIDNIDKLAPTEQEYYIASWGDENTPIDDEKIKNSFYFSVYDSEEFPDIDSFAELCVHYKDKRNQTKPTGHWS